ncbi:flagellar export protein FliJ [Gilvimarinus polysaccharolyticus]|uniref:flagellar export protein FliJ n=1 Tax=Gilvimarinus polysaccharolyticus TaxID=863921 RepID=UPI00067393A8|nr:flagellar export protein FliJ [Gilvimarinus polysaccharolyticus]
MAKRRSERLNVVLKVAEHHEREAAGYLAKYQQQLAAERLQLEQLEEYRGNYLREYGDISAVHTAADMTRYSDFIRRLVGAIDEQVRKVASAREQCDKVQQYWQQRRQKRKSLESLIERLRATENSELEYKLQKELDELAGLNRQSPPYH